MKNTSLALDLIAFIKEAFLEERNSNEIVSSSVLLLTFEWTCSFSSSSFFFYFSLSVPIIFPNLPPSHWSYAWIIYESQLCFVWYFIIFVTFWWKVKWWWYLQIPFKETKPSCSCWREFILFRHSSTHSDSNWKHAVQAEKACDLALWPQWTTHCLKTAVCMNVRNQESAWISQTTANGRKKKMLNTGFCVVASYGYWSVLHFILSLDMWCSNNILVLSVKSKWYQCQNVIAF